MQTWLGVSHNPCFYLRCKVWNSTGLLFWVEQIYKQLINQFEFPHILRNQVGTKNCACGTIDISLQLCVKVQLKKKMNLWYTHTYKTSLIIVFVQWFEKGCRKIWLREDARAYLCQFLEACNYLVL